MKQSVRFDTSHPNLCPALRWKWQFTLGGDTQGVPSTRDDAYWCVYTQTCVGPDGRLAEPHVCSSPERGCHREARRRLTDGKS